MDIVPLCEMFAGLDKRIVAAVLESHSYDESASFEVLLGLQQCVESIDATIGHGAVADVLRELEAEGQMLTVEDRLIELATGAPPPKRSAKNAAAKPTVPERCIPQPLQVTAGVPYSGDDDVGQLRAQLEALAEGFQHLRRENEQLRSLQVASDSRVATVEAELAAVSTARDELLSQQCVAAMMKDHLQHELREAHRQLDALSTELESANELLRLMHEDRERAELLIARHRAQQQSLQREMAKKDEEAAAQIAAATAAGATSTRVMREAQLNALKACITDHIFASGDVKATDCEYIGINPCLTTGWVLAAFVAGCQQFGFADVMDAIARKGVGVGFHGTPSVDNVATIFCLGFDPARRSGQAYGEGEYMDTSLTSCWGYARGCAVIVVLYLHAAPKPEKPCPANWRIVTNPPRESGITFMLPVLAIRQKAATAKPTLPICSRCV